METSEHTFTLTLDNIENAVAWARAWNQWTVDENCADDRNHPGHMFHPHSALHPHVQVSVTTNGNTVIYVRGWDGKVKTWHAGQTMIFDPNSHIFTT